MTDVRLLLGAAVAAPLAFVTLVLLPAGATDLSPPMDLGALLAAGGLLTIVLAPTVAGLAGCASLVALWQRRAAPSAERRMLVVSVLLVVGFLVLLASERSGAAVDWWLD